jgi:hypothetical protein
MNDGLREIGRRLQRDRLHLLPPSAEVGEGHLATSHLNNSLRHVEANSLELVNLNRGPNRLADPSSFRRLSLFQLSRFTPRTELLPDRHFTLIAIKAPTGNVVLGSPDRNYGWYARIVAKPKAKDGKHGGNRKQMSVEMSRHLQNELNEIIKRDFTKEDGKPMPERVMEEALGLSQSAINSIRNWKPGEDPENPRPIGAALYTVMKIADYKKTTIDAVLGRELPPEVQDYEEKLLKIMEKAEEVTKLLDRHSTFHFGPHSKIGKLREEIQKLASIARQNKALADRTKAVNAMPSSVRTRKVGT